MDKPSELTNADSRGSSTVIDRLEDRLLLAGDVSFDYANFANIDDLALRATAFKDGNTLQLNEIDKSKAGAVWHDTAFGLQTNASFSTQFIYSALADPFTGVGGEGFALLIQGNGANQNPTAAGDSLGYRGMSNSVAIELDMRDSNAGDPTNEHFGLHVNGALLPEATGISELNFNNGNDRFVWVDYDGASDLIEIYFNDSGTKPGLAVISETVDISEIVGDDAWIGFTASTSGYVGTHTVKSWGFESSGSGSSGGGNDNTTDGFELNGFGAAAPIKVVGDAAIANGRVRVTGNTPQVSGAVWYEDPIAIGDGINFNTSFTFRIDGGSTDNKGEGFAFVLQSNSDTALSPFVGNSLGYQNLRNSIAVEFDTFQNAFGEVSGNHVAVHVNGNRTNAIAATNFDDVLFNTSQEINVWIDYDQDATLMEIYVSNDEAKPSTPTLTANVDAAAQLGATAYAGFTASTSNRRNAHKIEKWAFDIGDPVIDNGDTFRFLHESYSFDESADLVDLTILREGSTSATSNVTVRFVNDSAIKGADFGLPTTNLVFLPGETEKTIQVRMLEDAVSESDESFGLNLKYLTNNPLPSRASIDVKIVDNESAVPTGTQIDLSSFATSDPIDTLSAANIANGEIVLTTDTAQLKGAAWSRDPIQVDGNTSLSSAFSFRIDGGNDDWRGEGLAFVLQPGGTESISDFVGNSLGYQGIEDAIAIEFDTFGNDFGEVSGNHVAVHLNGNRSNALAAADLPIELNSGSTVYAWVDYDASSEELQVFVAATNSKPASPIITTNVDLNGTVGDWFYAGFTASTSGRRNAHIIESLTLSTEQDTTPQPGTFAFTSGSASVNENGTTNLTINRTGGSDGAATVNLQTVNGTASNGDYSLSSTTLNFADGETSKTVTITPVNDTDVEGNETFTVQISSVTAGSIGGTDEVTVTIVDNDTAPTPGTFALQTGNLTLAESAGLVAVTIIRSGGSDGAATITLTPSNGSATQSSDFGLPNGTVTFADGQTSATFDVRILQDEIDENNETFSVAMSGTTAGSIGSPSTLNVTITDDDNPSGSTGTASLTTSSLSVNESNGTATLTIQRTGGTDGALTVNYATANGSANSGSDYTNTSGSVTFADGNATNQTVQVSIVDDSNDENSETFTFTLTGDDVGSPAVATITIVDNDNPPVDPNGFVNNGLMGVNLEKLGSGTTQWDFTDLMKNASFWAYTGSDSRAGQPVENLTENGYPILQSGEQARTVVRGWGNNIEDVVPAGQYTLTWEGTGEVGVFGLVNTGNFSSSGGSNSETIDIPRPDGTGASIRVTIASSDSNDPIRNVRLYMPGYGPGEANFGQVYHQAFLDYLQPFSILRLMDWSEASSSELENWSDRPTTDDFSYAENEFGVPIEDMVALANESGLDPWFNMPPRASDDYIQRFAQYVKNNLDPSLNLYIEYGNEVWAPTVGGNAAAAAGYNYVTERIADTGQSRSDQWADEIERDYEIWTNEFGGQADRINRVASGQGRNRNSINLQLLESLNRDGTLGVDTLSLAAYLRSDFSIVGDWNNTATPSPSLDDIFAALRLDLEGKEDSTIISGGSNDGQATGLWAWQRQLADQFGLNLIAYEGGQQLAPNSNTRTWYDEYVDAQTDPRMQELYNELLEKYLIDVGADGFIHYTTVGPIGSFGAWGLLEDQQQTLDEAPKYRGVVSFALGNPTLGENLYTFAENAGNQTLTLTRVGDTSSTLTVNVRTVDGVATAGSDFGSINQNVTFAAGQSQRTVNLSITNDNIAEATERLYLEVRYEDANGFIMDESVVVIEDNDALNGAYVNRDRLGVNLEKLTEFASQYDFADLMKHAFPWVFPEGTPLDGQRVPYDSLGNPILGAGQQAAAAVRLSDDGTWLSDFPDGAYTLVWNGTGTLEVENNGVSVGTYTSTGGSNTQTVNLTSANPGGSVILYIRSSDTSDPVQDFRLYMPGYAPGQANANQTFHSAVLDTIEPFGILRFMDWMKANLTTVEDWADRSRTNDVSYLMDDAGVPIQDIVELGNLATSHIWLNMPVRATDDYIRNMAQYVKDNLDPRLTVYVEYGNEVWAPTVGGQPGVGYGYITEQINASGRNEDDRIDVWSEEMVKDFNVWMDVFSEEPERVQRVASGQGRNRNSVNAQLLEALSSTGEVKFDVFSAAAYIRPVEFSLYDDWNDTSMPLPTADEIIDSLFDDLAIKFDDTILTSGAQEGQATGLWSWHRQLADQYGADLIAYEGGQQLFPGDRYYDVYAEAQRDPRMNDLYDDILQTYLVDVGADGFVHYSSVGSITPFGAWGAKEYQNQPNSEAPKYQALLDFANGVAPPPAAPLSRNFTAGDAGATELPFERPSGQLFAPLAANNILDPSSNRSFTFGGGDSNDEDVRTLI